MSITDEKIEFICENINEIKHTHRVEALQLILGSNIDRKKIVEKGSGTQIKISDLPKDIINVIYNFISRKIAFQSEELEKSDIYSEL